MDYWTHKSIQHEKLVGMGFDGAEIQEGFRVQCLLKKNAQLLLFSYSNLLQLKYVQAGNSYSSAGIKHTYTALTTYMYDLYVYAYMYVTCI